MRNKERAPIRFALNYTFLNARKGSYGPGQPSRMLLLTCCRNSKAKPNRRSEMPWKQNFIVPHSIIFSVHNKTIPLLFYKTVFPRHASRYEDLLGKLQASAWNNDPITGNKFSSCQLVCVNGFPSEWFRYSVNNRRAPSSLQTLRSNLNHCLHCQIHKVLRKFCMLYNDAPARIRTAYRRGQFISQNDLTVLTCFTSSSQFQICRSAKPILA